MFKKEPYREIKLIMGMSWIHCCRFIYSLQSVTRNKMLNLNWIIYKLNKNNLVDFNWIWTEFETEMNCNVTVLFLKHHFVQHPCAAFSLSTFENVDSNLNFIYN